MTAPTVRIHRLDLRLVGWAGHDHRVRPVVWRALELLRSRLGADRAAWPGEHAVARLTVPAIEVDLGLAGDEAVAARLAEAMHQALRGAITDGRAAWPS